MKQLVLLLIFITSLYGEAKIYMGANAAYQYEILYTSKKKAFNNTQNYGIKLGYGDIKAYSVEFSIDYIPNKASFFSDNDSEKYNFNIELLKSFDLNMFFIPYAKVGFGTGSMSSERALQSDITYGSFNGGIGAFIPYSEYIDLEIGYLYKRISYEKFNLLSRYETPTADQSNTYIGCNFRF